MTSGSRSPPPAFGAPISGNLSLPPVSKRSGDPIRRAEVRPCPQSPGLEATMPATNRLPLITLGWQIWSILVVVLTLVLAAAAYLVLV